MSFIRSPWYKGFLYHGLPQDQIKKFEEHAYGSWCQTT